MSINEYFDLSILSVGALIGPVRADGLMRIATLLFSGTVDDHKTKHDKYTGLTYRIYGGIFFARRKLDPSLYRAKKLILPYAADECLMSHYNGTYLPLRFRMLLTTTASDHSTGFDWEIKFRSDTNGQVE